MEDNNAHMVSLRGKGQIGFIHIDVAYSIHNNIVRRSFVRDSVRGCKKADVMWLSAPVRLSGLHGMYRTITR